MKRFKGAGVAAGMACGAALLGGAAAAFTPAIETRVERSAAAAATVAPHDARFLREAAVTGLMLIEAGQLAAQRAHDPAVRDLGRQLAKEDQNAIARLQTLAEVKGVALPRQPASGPQRAVEVLRRTHDEQFDRAFLERMVRDHHRAVDLFESALFLTMDPHVRSFVSKVLPTLRLHAEMAQGLRAAKY